MSTIVSIMEETVSHLDSHDDAELVDDISTRMIDLKRAQVAKQRELKEIIASYSGKINKLNHAIEKENTKLTQNARKAKEIEQKQSRVLSEIATMNEQTDDMARQMQELEHDLQLAKKRVEDAAQGDEIKVPKITHALSLYANISHIRWDFNTTDRVKGWLSVGDDESAESRPFDLDKRIMKSYEITNFLWDLATC